jgi:hypothetical protein
MRKKKLIEKLKELEVEVNRLRADLASTQHWLYDAGIIDIVRIQVLYGRSHKTYVTLNVKEELTLLKEFLNVEVEETPAQGAVRKLAKKKAKGVKVTDG